MSTINVDFINSATMSYTTIGPVNFSGSITIPTGASNGYVLTSNSLGDAYWTASSGGSSQNLSQVLQTGNNTNGSNIIMASGSQLQLFDYTSIYTQGSGSVNRITFNSDGNEFITKSLGVLGIYNTTVYTGIFDKGEIIFAVTPNNTSVGEQAFKISMCPDLNNSDNRAFVSSQQAHKFTTTINTRLKEFNNDSITVDQLLTQTLFYNGSFLFVSNGIVNLPTGTQICQAIPECYDGDTFEVNVLNTDTNTFTFSAGTNTSFPISGQNVISPNSSFKLLFYVSNSTSNTVEIYKI
jgi:hypothetical protein